MLIIFDLDDTLIDTFNSLVPLQLKRAINTLAAAGVVFKDRDSAFKSLLRLDRGAISSKCALEEFFEINDIDHSFLSPALHCVYNEIPNPLSVEAHSFAHDVLRSLSEIHKLAIVTIGDEYFQGVKIEKAGIDKSLFSKIIVTPFKNKKDIYKGLMQELQLDPSEIVVCGDRIENDLTPAKELGFKTVHVRQGRGLISAGNYGDVDFSIASLPELLPIIPKISNITSLMDNT